MKELSKEDKELLLRDLSARLTYGVIVNYKEDKYDFHKWKISTLHALAYSRSGSLINTDSDGWIEYNEYKGCGMSSGSRPLQIEITLPYLRPISSMTEEEKEELKGICSIYIPTDSKNIGFEDYGILVFTHHLTDNSYSFKLNLNVIDWLNAHHFDYRGLIERGLAIDCTGLNIY